MSKNGYNKLIKGLQEAEATIFSLRSKTLELNNTILELRTAATTSAEEVKPKSKYKELWTSTPAWTAIGMLAAIILSPFTVKLIYVSVGVILCVEIIRFKPIEDKRYRYLAKAISILILAAVMFLVWPHLPKPKAESNLDVALANFGDKLSDKVATRVETDDSSRKYSPPPPALPELHTPTFSIEPNPQVQSGPNGSYFYAEVRNGPGADIENVVYNADYFVAQLHEGDPYSHVVFTRYHTFHNANLLGAYSVQLPQNATVTAAIPIISGIYQNIDVMTYLMAPETGLLKFAGIRIIVSYKRAGDGRQFTYDTGYEFITNGGSTVQSIYTGSREYNSPAKKEILSISDVKQFLSDKSKWVDPVIKVTVNPDGSSSLSVVKN